MEGVFRFKIWSLNAPGLIHGGAYYRYMGIPEHLDATMTISMDISYCISASKLPSQKNLPTDRKISEKRTQTNFFFHLA